MAALCCLPASCRRVATRHSRCFCLQQRRRAITSSRLSPPGPNPIAADSTSKLRQDTAKSRHSLPIAAPMSTTVSSLTIEAPAHSCQPSIRPRWSEVEGACCLCSHRGSRRCCCCCRCCGEGIVESRFGGSHTFTAAALRLASRRRVAQRAPWETPTSRTWDLGPVRAEALTDGTWHSMHQPCRGDLPKTIKNKTDRKSRGLDGGVDRTGVGYDRARCFTRHIFNFLSYTPSLSSSLGAKRPSADGAAFLSIITLLPPR